MSGLRWTTGVGIALGGTGGAIAALMGVPQQPAPPPQAAPIRPVPVAATVTATVAAPATVTASPSATATAPGTVSPTVTASASSSATSPAPAPAPAPAPPLDIPSTRPALLKAMLYCDQRKDFDACASVAVALDSGTTGPADPQQAKRFRKIALTHLVAQCEAASARACRVLAAKYRAGTELTQNLKGAEALEQRAAELCRLHPGPDCPSP